jgi:hypothetical protein
LLSCAKVKIEQPRSPVRDAEAAAEIARTSEMRERPTNYRARDTDFWSRLTLASAEGFFTRLSARQCIHKDHP